MAQKNPSYGVRTRVTTRLGLRFVRYPHRPRLSISEQRLSTVCILPIVLSWEANSNKNNFKKLISSIATYNVIESWFFCVVSHDVLLLLRKAFQFWPPHQRKILFLVWDVPQYVLLKHEYIELSALHVICVVSLVLDELQ